MNRNVRTIVIAEVCDDFAAFVSNTLMCCSHTFAHLHIRHSDTRISLWCHHALFL